MLAERGFAPVDDGTWRQFGEEGSTLLLVGTAKVIKPAFNECLHGNKIEVDCGWLACAAHYREYDLAIMTDKVYLLIDAECTDDENTIRAALKEEYEIPLLEPEN